ncbi:MAG: hypothetical protein HYT28_00975 [Parcubacteria group bacterium]|nr:hypothetical protein [Parcubacteria group bacterium]
MASNSQDGPEKFGAIGARLGGQAEELKKTLFPGLSSEEVSESKKEKPTESISAAHAIPIKEGTGVGVTIQKQGKESWFQAGTEKKEAATLAQYDRPGKKKETNEELIERLSKERKEREEREKQLRTGAKEAAAVAPAFFQIPEREPVEPEKEKKETVKNESDEALGIPESAARFQASATEKKSIIEELKKETDTEKRKNLWHKKNHIILEHQRNWAAFAYENAQNEEQKNKAKEDFVFANKMLAEYTSDPGAYEKKNKWEYQDLPAQPVRPIAPAAEEPDAAIKKEEESEKPTNTPLQTENLSEEKIPLVKEETAKNKGPSSITEEHEPTFSVAEELERALKEKTPIATAENKETSPGADVVGTPREPQNNKPIEQLGETMSPEDKTKIEQRIENLNKTLDAQAEQIEKDAEKKGYLDFIRDVGRNYKKARLTFKIALPLAVLAGVSSGGVAALLGASVGIVARIGAGATVFVGAEAFLEKKRQEKERWWNKNPKIMAAVSAGIMAGPVMSKVISATNADEWLSHTWDKVFGGGEVAQSALEQTQDKIIPPPTTPSMTPEVKAALEQAHEAMVSPSEVAPAPSVATVIEHVAPVAALESIHTVVSGENLHNIIANMKELSELDGGRKENAIANILEQINKNPIDYGVASGDVNRLAIGDHINMEKIHAAFLETKIGGESIVEHAQHLTTEQVAHIEAPQHEVVSETTPVAETEPKPLSVEDRNAQDVKNIDELEKQYKVGKYAVASQADAGAFDISDKGIAGMSGEVAADMSATENLTKTIQRGLEHVFGVGERELGDTSWTVLQSENAEEFLDKFSLDMDSPEEKLKDYLNTMIHDTKINPRAGETILDYLTRIVEQDVTLRYSYD